MDGAVPGDAEIVSNFGVFPFAEDDGDQAEVAEDDDGNEDQMDGFEETKLLVLVDTVVDRGEARVVSRGESVEHRLLIVRFVNV